ncbi:hypothetical protein A1O3_04984 [Capronia epimyces CBS 606.96]|uniref:TATA element modulatory factor 1 TATA binding domain-containing protein n=1 Tax=Capronia epimyces CBS 606.96 TaxID=1182542 RepID=W9XUT3_9EURO|nr:uncharacterized protein A1O3_04984 [Capronia epimyces CBS 606.96]EXJ84317.1 hypothetical protein A1O3_04984 [Capronia epimyces CBS 606.96]
MTSKPTSRWNFLQHAVASVESKLDTILAEENDPLRRSTTPAQASRDTAPSKRSMHQSASTVSLVINVSIVSSELSRSSSNASASNDRLQERLARAMAKKNGSRPETPPTVIDQSPTRPPNDDAPATSSENTRLENEPEVEGPRAENASRTTEDAALGPHGDSAISGEDVKDLGLENLVPTTKPAGISTEVTGVSQTLLRGDSQDIPRKGDDASMRPEAEETEKIQEETGTYIERIDALQAKLQYLSNEAALSARQAATSADGGSLERKLAEKDEKIALLIEEGTRLSKSEMAYLTALKRLKAQVVAKNKEQEAMKLRAERAERSLKTMEDRASKAESASKKAEQQLMTSLRTVSDLEAIKKERDALHATLAEMKTQLSKANLRAEAAESKAQSDQLEKERKRITELEDDLTSARVEREISDDKLRREIEHLQATLEKEKEQARAMESEMLSEQAALESKLEAFRVRAEEAASTDQGHQQAKLLRQIETLQSQYASASQNWQGIESTLLGRITNLEKERDEVAARDTDLRKKLRDATLKLKGAQRELENLQTGYADMEKSLAEANEETERLGRKVRQLEEDLATALKEAEEQKATAARELKRKVEEEKAKWTATLHIQRTESPALSTRKNSSMASDMNHLMSPVQYERPSSRRSSVMPGVDPNTPPPQQSTTSFRGVPTGSVPETPSVVASMDQDEYFANIPPTPLSASHHSHRGVNDLISASTVGAGPSVQLVERMSANVRRLESEKAASKDELLRIATQRDEARQEVVSLMREVEEKRKVEARLNALEKEHQSLNERHQTTLEMLGEKSEQVEELKADILDVKQMYRQLVDTMK